MRDNPRPADAAFFDLPDHRILTLDGRDAPLFAQAQFMNDVAALAEGHWHWNGWLTPKGRVIALFALLKLDAQTIWLLLPDAEPTHMASSLQRFVFRSKVVLAARDDLKVSGRFAPPMRAHAAAICKDDGGTVELDMGSAAAARTLRISTAQVAADVEAAARWNAFDLTHGLPCLPPSQAEQWTPQQLSLDRLRAYSIRKGCYPGQEIVARTHFLGQAKRGLALLASEVAVPVGSEVRDSERNLGTTISAASSAGVHRSLAVLPLEREAAMLHVDGIALRDRPLLEGLAR